MDKFTEKLADIVFKFLPRRFVLPLFILGIFPAVWNAYEPFLPDGVPRWVPLALDGLLFFLALLKWRVPPESPPAGGRYFIGPRAYTEGETERFFGRPAAIDTCVAALQVHPFFILEAESGCGKSSLVYAGLIPKLQKTFFIEVMRCTNGREERIWPVSSENAAQQRPRLVFYDQFEELFTTAKDTERAAFLQKLREALNRGERRVCLVIRQDFYDLLRRLCETVDPDAQTLKYQRYYTLEPFDSTTALGVLSKLTELPETDPFLTTLVGDLLRPPREAKLSSEDTKTVLPVELQTVGSVLDHVGLRQADYATAGGKVGLLRRFLEDATAHVYRISRVPPEASLRLLRALISDAKTNAPKTIGEIHALYPGFSKPVIRKIMDAFAERWLVRQVPRDGLEEPPYEFVHEHLILALDEAPTPALIREREAQERLAFWIERSDAAFQPLPAKRTRRQQLVRWFAAPIPLVETFVLWKRASTIQRRELRRSLNGWMRILVSLAIAAGVLFAGPYYYTRTWRYQLDAMVQSAPLNTATEISVTHYLRMLTWARPLESHIEAIKDDAVRSSVLPYIALTLGEVAKAGKPQEALIALEKLRTAAEAIKNDYDRSVGLSTIAKVLGEIAQTDKLQEGLTELQKIRTAVEAIQEYDARTRGLVEVASALAEAGKPDEALEVWEQILLGAKTIEENSFSEDTWSALAEALAEVAKVAKPQQTRTALEKLRTAAAAIKNHDARSSALSIVAKTLGKIAQSGKSQEVLTELREIRTAVEGIQQNDARSRGLFSVAVAFAQAGGLEEALAAASPIKNARSEILWAVAGEATQAGKSQEVLSELEKLRIAAEGIKVENARSSALSTVARALGEVAKAGAPQLALTELEKIRTTAETIKNETARSTVLNSVAPAVGEVAKAGKSKEALTALERLRTAAEGIKNDDARWTALSIVAQALGEVAQAGMPQEALTVLEKIQTPAKAIQDSPRPDIVSPLFATLGALAKAGKPQEVLMTLEKIRTAPETSQSDYARLRALSFVTGLLGEVAQHGEAQQALTALRKIWTAVEAIDKDEARMDLMYDLANALENVAKAGKPEEVLIELQKIQIALEAIKGFFVAKNPETAIAQALVEVAKAGKPQEALMAAQAIISDDARFSVLYAIAESFSKLGKTTETPSSVKTLGVNAEQTSRTAPSDRAKRDWIVFASRCYVAAGMEKRGRELADAFTDSDSKLSTYALIIEGHLSRSDPTFNKARQAVE